MPPTVFAVGFLLGLLSHIDGQESPAGNLVGGEVVCGYAGRYIAVAAEDVRRGLYVAMLPGDATAGRPVPLRFRVALKPGDDPVDDLQVEHEKFMHVIGVREDLGEIFHIHPQRALPGLWEVVHTFTNGGRYHIWADVKRRGMVHSFGQPALTVPGKTTLAPPVVVPTLQDSRGGYEIILRPSSPFLAGRTNAFQIEVRDRSGRQVGMEFYLGAIMHLVIVMDDLSACLHGHALNHDKSDPTVHFTQVFPRPGNYKLFAQFRPQGEPLARDEALLAEFWVNVKSPD